MPRKKKEADPPQSLAPVSEEVAALRAMSFEKRVDQTMLWIISGQRDLTIAETMAEAWPGEDQTKLLTAVMTKFEEAAAMPPDFVKGWIYESRKELYRNLIEIGDFAAARGVLRDMESANK